MKIVCPACRKADEVDDTIDEIVCHCDCGHVWTDLGLSETHKACPFCAEIIAWEAIKCKHCGSFVDGRDVPQAVPSVTNPNPTQVIVKENGEGLFLRVMNVGCAIALIFIVLLLIGGCSVLDGCVRAFM
jgi:hypothetical protein